MTAPARRPWWSKKRWAAAGLLWLGVVYVMGEGPADYAVARGWVPPHPVRVAYLPAEVTVGRLPLAAEARSAYRGTWSDVGLRDRTRFMSVRGAGWSVAVSSDVDQDGVAVTEGLDGGDVMTVRIGTSEVVVENGRATPAGGFAWGGPVALDGRPVAALPPGTSRLTIGYFDGELAVEADGEPVEVGD